MNINSKFKNLSKRELEVLQLLINGEKTINISKKLNIKSNTVSTYKKLIYYKIGVENVIQLYEYVKMHSLDYSEE
jgi:DNA-binding NarL/FixJ family response regulator